MKIKECTCFFGGYDFCAYCTSSGVIIEQEEFDRYISSGGVAKVEKVKKFISIDERVEEQLLVDDGLVSDVIRELSLGFSFSKTETDYFFERILSRIKIWKELIKKNKVIAEKFDLINHVKEVQRFYNSALSKYHILRKRKNKKI